MKQNQPPEAEQASRRIGKGGIAAIIAFSLILIAVLCICITHKHRNSAANSQCGMALMDAMPTGIVVSITNSAVGGNPAYSAQYLVMQNGEKAADVTLSPVYNSLSFDFSRAIPEGVSELHLCYPKLPAGRYTLVNLAEDGRTEGVLGHLDFQISSAYDDMVFVPDYQRGACTFEQIQSELQALGVNVEQAFAISDDPAVRKGDVLGITVAPYHTEAADGYTHAYYHFDGSGYWINKGDTVTVHVQNVSGTDPAD